MKKVFLNLLILLFSLQAFPYGTENAEICVKDFARLVDVTALEKLPIQHQGRLKPFYTFSRESMLFLSGKYKPFKTNAIAFYLGMIVCEQTPNLKIINIREPGLRKKLGFSNKDRFVSIKQIEESPLEQLAQPIAAKEEKNSRSLEPEEKNLLELYGQYWFAKRIHSGNHFLGSIDTESLSKPASNSNAPHHGNLALMQAAKEYLTALAEVDKVNLDAKLSAFLSVANSQQLPSLFEGQKEKFGVEIFYYKSNIFFITGILFLLIGIISISRYSSFVFEKKIISNILVLLPIILIAIGFGIRVYVTGFAPVTNMYGTMIWVAFGISLFSIMLHYLYNNKILIGVMFIASSGFLLLTESIPLILSPNMDPIVAVLRSNLWLTIHVLTIVISYAAFSISMVLGNFVMIRSIITSKYNDKLVKDFGVASYRSNQLGVFLLTIGIILGGVWADYSWGRFWGWDPKETWALIADVGFLILLHGRYIGWITNYGMAVGSAVAYLLVIFAWYGVNFLLATGLHSYGFSSGGATIVVSFVIIQLVLIACSLILKQIRKPLP